MKKQFVSIIAVAFISISMVQAQDTSQNQDLGQEGDPSQIEDPSGAEVQLPQVPVVTDPTVAGDPAQQQPQTTVTVSQTFTNQTNSITIIGTVDRAEDKQTVEQSLRQALPGKAINNQLKVASQEQSQITEPSGAESSSENQNSEEQSPEEITPQPQPELNPEADQSESQP